MTTSKSPRKPSKRKTTTKSKRAKTKASKTAKKPKAKAKAKSKPKASKSNVTTVANGNSKYVKVEFYKDKLGEHRWRLVKRGRIIGASTEGYKRAASAKANFKSLAAAMGNVKL